jgi:hypothetical protein
MLSIRLDAVLKKGSKTVFLCPCLSVVGGKKMRSSLLRLAVSIGYLITCSWHFAYFCTFCCTKQAMWRFRAKKTMTFIIFAPQN